MKCYNGLIATAWLSFLKKNYEVANLISVIPGTMALAE
jgi:hypothetical protein